MEEKYRKLQEEKITMKEYLNIETGFNVTIVPNPLFDEPSENPFLSYVQESIKKVKEDGR
jgi:hypothetical protein